MPAKNNHPYSQVGVFEYIQDNRGIRYQCNQLARVFRCSPDDMRDTLDALVAKKWIETASSGRAKLFFIRGHAEAAAIDGLISPTAPKPYKQAGPAWSEVSRRLAEFRAIPSLHVPR